MIFRTAGASCLIFLCAIFAAGQNTDWRPISDADLKADKPTVEPDADAEALLWEVRIDDSSRDDVDIWHYVRVKIFTERGRERHSRFDIPYVKGTKIKDLAARVVRPDGTTNQIGAQDIFEREILRADGIKVNAKSFAVPGIEPGVIVEYRYKEAVDDRGALGMRLPLQRDLPVRELVYYYRPHGTRGPEFEAYNISDLKFVKDKKEYWRTVRYNIPAFRAEPYMPPENTLRPWILLTPSSPNALDPDDLELYWSTFGSWARLKLAQSLKDDREITEAARIITAGATNDEEKLRSLYRFCQREIRNLTFFPPNTERTRKDRYGVPIIPTDRETLKLKEAQIPRQINSLFAALAGALAMDVQLVYTGHRGEVLFNPKIMNTRLLHLAGIAVKTEGGFRFFNPGDPFLPFGMLPWHDEDSWALLVGMNDQRWMKTPTSGRSENHFRRKGDFTLTREGILEGVVEVQISGQPALSYRHSNYELSIQNLERSLSQEIKETISHAEISDVHIENVKDPDRPLTHRYSIRIPNYAPQTGSRLFIQPNVFAYGKSPLFSSSVRTHDIFFPYSWSESDEISIKLPEEFVLDSADRPQPVSDPDHIGKLNVAIRLVNKENRLLYDRKFEFGVTSTLQIRQRSYGPLKRLFDMFHRADSHVLAIKYAESSGQEK